MTSVILRVISAFVIMVLKIPTTCPFYDNLRAALVYDVSDIIQRNNVVLPGKEIDLYLYAHPSLNESDNKIIISCTIKYVNETSRFAKSYVLPCLPPSPSP